MSKLRSVIRHEYTTIVKQPSFWILMLAIPALIGFIIALSIFSNKTSAERIESVAKDIKNVAIIDKSGLINKDIVASAELTLSPVEQADALQSDVREGKKDALVVFPENLAKERNYQLYLSSNDLTKMSATSTLAESLLKTSLFLPLGSPEVIALAQTGASADMTFYKDGEKTNGFNEYIAPGIFVVLFYVIFAFSISYMLTSVSEEKENRSMEMVLTYVKPQTLILGKLLAVMLVTLTQVAFFAVLIFSAFTIALKSGMAVSLPLGLDLAKVTFDPLTIFFGLAFLFIGFLMYAGFMIATAAIAPSTKEANSFSGVFFIGAFIPFYFIYMIATDPTNPLVNFLTYFPLTSPVVTLIRNTVGNFSGAEGWLALAVMTAFMVITIWIAVRAFKLGALEFSQVVKLSKLVKK